MGRGDGDGVGDIEDVVGEWRFDPADGTLTRDGDRRRLEDRAARTLALLCRRRGEVVSRQEILAQVWAGRSVSPNSVAVVIGDIRKAIDDTARPPLHLETLPKRGYRLRARVPAERASQTPAEPIRRPGLRRRAVLGAAVAAAIGGLAIAVDRGAGTRRERIFAIPLQNDTGSADWDRLARALALLVTTRLASLPGVEVSPGPPFGHGGLLFRSRLILWNEQVTLSLEAISRATDVVVWAGMADGPASRIAANTLAQIARFADLPALHDARGHGLRDM